MTTPQNETTIRVLDVIGDLVLKLGTMAGGPFAGASTGVAALLKTSAVVMRSRGISLDQLIKEIKPAEPLRPMNWDRPKPPHGTIEDTQRETPFSKKRDP